MFALNANRPIAPYMLNVVLEVSYFAGVTHDVHAAAEDDAEDQDTLKGRGNMD